MGDKFRKALEKFARRVAHGDEALTELEHALLWVHVFFVDDDARLVSLLEASTHPTDTENVRRARELGKAAASIAALVDVMVVSRKEGANLDVRRSFVPVYSFHDWPSFEMDLDQWTQRCSRPALLAELRSREGTDGWAAAETWLEELRQ